MRDVVNIIFLCHFHCAAFSDDQRKRESTAEKQKKIVYQVVIGNNSFNVDDDDYEHDEMTYNTLGQNLDVAVNETTVGRIVISSGATVTLEDNMLSLSGGNADFTIAYGKATDEVLVGKWSGNDSGTADVKDTLAVRRGNVFYVKNTLAAGKADMVVAYGKSTDTALSGDWDGDGFDTLAVRRGNICYLQKEIGNNTTLREIVYGKITDEVYVGVWSN